MQPVLRNNSHLPMHLSGQACPLLRSSSLSGHLEQHAPTSLTTEMEMERSFYRHGSHRRGFHPAISDMCKMTISNFLLTGKCLLEY
jgi:hypothetical protein